MRSKPDPVDQPERTAHYDCAILCNVQIESDRQTEMNRTDATSDSPNSVTVIKQFDD